MCLDDPAHLIDHCVLGHGLGCQARAHPHDFNCNDAHLTVPRGGFLSLACINLGQKVNVRIQSDADAVEKQDRQPRLGSVRPVPVRKPLGGRLGRGEDCERTKRENAQEAHQRCAMEVERVVEERDRCHCVNDKHALRETQN